jgi:superoxide dismutase, Fe-Mn family
MKFRLPTLPFGHSDLEPFLSAETIDTHYFGHHKNYIDKTNELMSDLGFNGVTLEKIILNHEGKLFDNASQAWNHTFFWMGLKAKPAPIKRDTDFFREINRAFGSFERMKDVFLEHSQNLFGSGYTWLVTNNQDRLEFINTQNADNPICHEHIRPLWTCDIWEHAYYIDYRNERREYLEGAWEHVNWEFVEENYRHKRIPNMTRFMVDDASDVPDHTARM